MVGVTRIFKLVVLGRDHDPNLGTEYDQLAILNDDFTLNMEKLAQQVCLNALSTCTYKNDLFHPPGPSLVRCFSAAVQSQQNFIHWG